MPFTLDQVIPWGRSFGEYLKMFAFADRDLTRDILGVGDGPACFNARLSRLGGRVRSCDPLYLFDAGAIRRRIAEVYPLVLAQLERNRGDYLWHDFATPAALAQARLAAMEEFLADYEGGGRGDRYLAAALPHLPFAAGAFELVLCSHLLFSYSAQLDEGFHVAAALELARVGAEVRIFPLLEIGGRPSPHLAAVTAALERAGRRVERVAVPYEFQRGGNEMLRIA